MEGVCQEIKGFSEKYFKHKKEADSENLIFQVILTLLGVSIAFITIPSLESRYKILLVINILLLIIYLISKGIFSIFLKESTTTSVGW